jgi:hypothetical protein
VVLELAAVAAEKLAVPVPDVQAQAASWNLPLAEVAPRRASAAVPCTPDAAQSAERSSSGAAQPGLPGAQVQPSKRSVLPEHSLLRRVARQYCRKQMELTEAAALLAAAQQPAVHLRSAAASQLAHSAALPEAAVDE